MSQEFQSELFPALPASPEVVVPATPPTTDSVPSTPSAAPRESAAKSPSAPTLNTTLTHILQKLELMPEPATRFALCEKQVQNHAEVLAEGDAEAVVLDPGDSAVDPARVSDVDTDRIAPDDAHRAFAHHSAAG